jgi:hypothetical protein
MRVEVGQGVGQAQVPLGGEHVDAERPGYVLMHREDPGLHADEHRGVGPQVLGDVRRELLDPMLGQCHHVVEHGRCGG